MLNSGVAGVRPQMQGNRRTRTREAMYLFQFIVRICDQYPEHHAAQALAGETLMWIPGTERQNSPCRCCSRAIARTSIVGSRFDACALAGFPRIVQLDRPTVSAMAAPRLPGGLSCPVVESRAV